MKAEKKPLSIKHEIREERKKEQRIGLIATIALLIGIILISAFVANSLLSQPSNDLSVNLAPTLRAAIIDQLSVTFPNQTFVETANRTLLQAGYEVDYYPSEQVTVEFYKNLPAHNYRLIIMRVHSVTVEQRSVALFTSESYSKSKYVYEQLEDRVISVAYSREESEKGICYFGVTSFFIESNMRGDLPMTTVIIMGCEGLNNPKMAEAFIKRGAGACIGWNVAVSATRTDTATTYMLEELVIEKATIRQALYKTMIQIGVDPQYNSILGYYPQEVGNETIENVISRT